jgi:hypothetical protein
VARQLTASLRRGPSADPKALLTAREREILLLVAHGKANKEIAGELMGKWAWYLPGWAHRILPDVSLGHA